MKVVETLQALRALNRLDAEIHHLYECVAELKDDGSAYFMFELERWAGEFRAHLEGLKAELEEAD